MMKIFLPQETLSVIKNTYIFIDTCILLDYSSFKNKEDRDLFLDKLSMFTKNGCVFVAIEPVEFEFYLGSTKQDLKIKKDYFEQIIEIKFPNRVFNKESIEALIIEYGIYARGALSYTDLMLGVAVNTFPNTLVLTRNYKDFPLKIFDCSGVFTVHLNKEARTYCFYRYPANKQEKKITGNNIPF